MANIPTMHLIRYILAAVALCIAFCTEALDLPVKTINGRQYYYYKVKGNESVYGIARKLGISTRDVIKHNPSVADRIKKNTKLYFPVDEFSDNVAQVEDSAEVAVVEVDTVVPTIQRRPLAVLSLPFNLNGDRESRQAKHALDFYKGFLIAADTLAERSGRVEIQAVDSKSMTLSDSLLQTAAVVVAPDDAALMSSLAARCAQNGTYMLNLMNARDNSYLTNPYVLQANIPAEMMYRKAVQGLMENYGDYTPVIIRNVEGRNEKEPFTKYLAAYCDSVGKECVHIEYNGNLNSSGLALLDARPTDDFVIIPSSGSLAEFNKFAYVVRNFRDGRRAAVAEEAVDSVPTQKIAVFGYPDWIAFRGEPEELLHAMEATIYSRFHDDYDSFMSRNLGSDFIRWYGTPMIESVPSQGILGFDAGCFIIKNIRANNGRFEPQSPAEYKGVQSTFRFQRVGDGGWVNTALYIVEFLPSGLMNSRVL